MKEKQKIFIRGNKDRGDEIRGLLAGLGATNYVSCDNDNYIYFINHENKISATLIDSEVGRIIMDNYKEIELPKMQWEDGDTLVNNNYPSCRAVFKKYNDGDTFDAYFILYDKAAYFDALAHVEDYHLASAEELKAVPSLFTFLMGALNEVGICSLKKAAQSPEYNVNTNSNTI